MTFGKEPVANVGDPPAPTATGGPVKGLPSPKYTFHLRNGQMHRVEKKT
jgi:hypothetical protein